MNKKEIKPISIRVLSVIILMVVAGILFFTITNSLGLIQFGISPSMSSNLLGLFVSIVLGFTSYGLWKYKSWAKSILIIFAFVIIFIFLISAIFEFSSIVFAGKEVTPIPVIFRTFTTVFLIKLSLRIAIPVALISLLQFQDEGFSESQTQRNFIDKIASYILLIAASSSILIVLLIFLFTFSESTEAIEKIGLGELLIGTVWRPGSIIGNKTAQFGLVPMVLGSIYSTIGAVMLGVPLSIGTAILLAEIAPPLVRNIFRPAIELLAGIPSVIFGLFGMIIIAPLIRNFEIPGNSGFGLLNASIILAVMILPTVTNIAEDAIRAVPDSYRQASLAVGATQWQTIMHVVLPASRSGLIAAVILGIGRALGETMALIMVIGNAIAIPTPLNNNPLTIMLSAARTLTGNIAVEINYAEGVHRSALFFTGVLLFVLLLVINRIAHFMMRGKKPS